MGCAANPVHMMSRCIRLFDAQLSLSNLVLRFDPLNFVWAGLLESSMYCGCTLPVAFRIMPLCEICAGLIGEAFSEGPRLAVSGKFCYAGQYADSYERCALCQYIHDGRLDDQENCFLERLKQLDAKEILDVGFGKLPRPQPSGFVNIARARQVSDGSGKPVEINALLTFSVREGMFCKAILSVPSGSPFFVNS
jgi:hypothetical protein